MNFCRYLREDGVTSRGPPSDVIKQFRGKLRGVDIYIYIFCILDFIDTLINSGRVFINCSFFSESCLDTPSLVCSERFSIRIPLDILSDVGVGIYTGLGTGLSVAAGLTKDDLYSGFISK